MIMIGILFAQTANWRISLIDTEMPVNATCGDDKAELERTDGMEMDVRIAGYPCNLIFSYDDHYAGKCSLAGKKRAGYQGPKDPQKNWW